MEQPNDAAGAQGNTDANAPQQTAQQQPEQQAAATNAPDAQNQPPAAPSAGDQGAEKPGEAKQDGGKKAEGGVPKSFLQEVTEEKEGQGDSAETPDPEAYQLQFPEGAVADSEAVAVLNRVGKEFGISGDKAQELATAATEYGNRRVEAQLEHFKKGYEDFCKTHLEQTKAMFGEKAQEAAKESVRGWDAFLRTINGADGKPMSASDVLSDPNFAALGNVGWFIKAGQLLSLHMTEGQSITGGKGGAEGNVGDFSW